MQLAELVFPHRLGCAHHVPDAAHQASWDGLPTRCDLALEKCLWKMDGGSRNVHGTVPLLFKH